MLSLAGLKSFENIYVNKKIIGKLNDELQKLKESDDFIEGIKSLREKENQHGKNHNMSKPSFYNDLSIHNCCTSFFNIWSKIGYRVL